MRFTKRSPGAVLPTKQQYHPHHKDTAASKGKGKKSFSHGCNWDLGEAEVEMALGGVFFSQEEGFFD